MTEERKIKIAVIGATEPTYQSSEVRVACFPWNRLKKVANLADYDVVILDLLSLKEPEELDVLAFRKVLDVRTVQQVLSKVGVPFSCWATLGSRLSASLRVPSMKSRSSAGQVSSFLGMRDRELR